MLKIKIAAAVVLALCASGLALATPAQADTVSGSCSTWAGNLEGNAHFTRDGSGWRNWYLFAGKLHGSLGNNNNVDFFFYQDYAQHWTNWSPDNVRPDTWYSAGANINMPPFSIQQARWMGTFDVAGPDPRCSAWSELVSG